MSDCNTNAWKVPQQTDTEQSDRLICDMFCVILGWAVKFCELSDTDPNDMTSYPMSVVADFRNRMKLLGVRNTDDENGSGGEEVHLIDLFGILKESEGE